MKKMREHIESPCTAGIAPNPAAAGIFRDTDHHFPVHLHSRFYIFAHIFRRSCVCFGRQTSRPVPAHIARQGDIVIIPPGTPHSGYPYPDKTCSYRAMYVNSGFVDGLLPGNENAGNGVSASGISPAVIPGAGLAEKFSACIDLIIPESESESESETQGDIFHQQEYLLPEFEEEFIAFIEGLEAAGAASVAPGREMLFNMEKHRGKEEEQILHSIRRYILDHLTRKISLDELASECGRSKYHLVRTFKAYEGLPPVQFQQLERINKAKGMLKEGCSLSETAMDLGFYDQSHFQNKFKSFTGITPSQYLNGQQG